MVVKVVVNSAVHRRRHRSEEIIDVIVVQEIETEIWQSR